MSLSALTWKQLPTQTIALGTTTHEAKANAIYTAFTATAYADGVARSQGSGVAWTCSRFQSAGVTEAVYLVPVSSSITQKVIFGGSAGAKTPTIASGNGAYVANQTYVGLNKNSGAYNAWDNASPFTSGQFSGYGALCTLSASYATTVRCYESLDAVVVTFEQNGSHVGSCIVGGFIDPESADTTNDAESDGILYGLSVSGTNAGTATNLFVANAAGSTSTTSLLNTVATASPAFTQGKFYIFTPGSSTLLYCTQLMAGSVGTSLKSRSGKNVKVPVLLALYNGTGSAFSGSPAAPTTPIGRAREIWAVQTAANGTLFRNVGTDVGYLLSNSSANSNSAGLMLSR